MKYAEFRDSIISELLASASGMTWKEIRNRLHLPYENPCPEWISRMERENWLVREKGFGRAYIWRIVVPEEGFEPSRP